MEPTKPKMFDKNSVLAVSCACENCDKEHTEGIYHTWEIERVRDFCPVGFARVEIDGRFNDAQTMEPRTFYFCEKHAKELLPGFFEYFNP